MIQPTPSQLMLDSGIVNFGVTSNAEDIGTDAINIEDHFVGSEYAKVESGTQVFNLPTEYTDAKVAVPRYLYRSDDVESMVQINGNFFSEQIESLAFFLRRDSQLAYATNGANGAQTNDILHLGTSRPANSTIGILVDGFDVGGTRWIYLVFTAINKAADQAFTFDATHTKISGMFEATPLPAQTTRTRNLGLLAKVS